ncbi:MAG: cyclic nucleotide-binding protein [Chloroflexi bacterium]|nr:MAG: cyclic nucleotide-binding protein [Chloroflexota bacterium]MBL1195580.1 cyclic nucleotide-binding protein [Chloroflexota bacterium]NOH12865.1 cyclic nucleotide-binding domain-containing protein [Chloroflexota bacterium]
MAKFDIFNHEDDVREYAAGETIFEQGSIGDLMYAVLEGEIELYFEDAQFDTLVAGEIFGEMALLDQTPRSASARAKTDVKVAAINKDRFLWLVQQTPMFALQVMGVMADRVRRRTEDAAGS